jgi:hypothetical protein
MDKRRALSRPISIAACVGLIAGHAAPASAADQGFDLMPLLQVDRNLADDGHFRSPVGGYVRFWVERVRAGQRCRHPEAPASAPRDYTREARDPLTRWLWGRSYSRILQAKLTVTRSTLVTQSVTLASSSHDSSSRAGENWTSEVGERVFLTPYFRVDQGSTAAIEVRLKTSRETDAAVTQNVLALVRTGASLVAPPTAPLVTALNGDRLKQTSNFLDSAINSLFQERLAETSQSDFPADRWVLDDGVDNDTPTVSQDPSQCDVGRAVASIAANFPMAGHVWRNGGSRDLGEWRIYVSEPMVSIFSTVPLYPRANVSYVVAAGCGQGSSSAPTLGGADLQACIAFSGLVPTRVLNLTVGENTTLGQALRGDAGIAAAVQRFQGASAGGNGRANAATSAANSENRETTGREVCNLIGERADALGLNSYDAAAAVWAFAWNGGLNPTLSSDILTSSCQTAQLARRLGLPETPKTSQESASQSPTETAQ